MGFVIRICLNITDPNRLKQLRFYSQGTNKSKNLRYETLYMGDYKYVNISSFALLGIKLWLEEEGDLNRNDPLYSFKFIQSKLKGDKKMPLSFSYKFISNIANLKIFAYL